MRPYSGLLIVVSTATLPSRGNPGIGRVNETSVGTAGMGTDQSGMKLFWKAIEVLHVVAVKLLI